MGAARVASIALLAAGLLPVPARAGQGHTVQYVQDLVHGGTRRVSVSSDGKTGNGSSLGPSISSAGRRVVFWSAADNLVKGADGHDPDVYLHSVATERTTILTAAGEGATAQTGDSGQSINGDGRRVAYELIESPIGGALEYHYLVRISPPEPCSGWTGLTTEGWPTI